MRRLLYAAKLCLLAVVTGASAQEVGNHSNGVAREVTVYRDRAFVAREVVVPAGDQSRSVEVHDLPELIIPDGVFAEGDENTTVRAVRVSSQPVDESNREKVRELESQIQVLQHEHAKTLHALTVVSKTFRHSIS